MFAFLTVNFWIGVVLGASFPLFWAKVWAFVKAKFTAKEPVAAAEIAAAEAVVAPVVESVAAPVVAKIDAAITPKQ